MTSFCKLSLQKRVASAVIHQRQSFTPNQMFTPLHVSGAQQESHRCTLLCEGRRQLHFRAACSRYEHWWWCDGIVS